MRTAFQLRSKGDREIEEEFVYWQLIRRLQYSIIVAVLKMETVKLVICLALVATSCSLLSEKTDKTESDVRVVVNPIIIRAVKDYSLTLAKTEMYTSNQTIYLKGIGKMIYRVTCFF